MVVNACEEKLPPLQARIGSLSTLEPWLVTTLQNAVHETALLHRNGAEQAVRARISLLEDLIAAAEQWLSEDIEVAEAACVTGRCEETIRRRVRSGKVPDRRTSPRGRIRIRRGDVIALEQGSGSGYDPVADAQDIATLRRLK